MAEIAWTNEALHWLEDIFEYIAADNPDFRPARNAEPDQYDFSRRN